MPIDTKTLLELRKITGAGMNDCQTALDESHNDIEKAIEILRKKGAAKAVKKSQRSTKEGVIGIGISHDRSAGVIIPMLCETDFVARNNEFISYAESLVQKALNGIRIEKEFDETKKDMILKMGENIMLGNFKILRGEYIESYLHSNRKVGVLVAFDRTMDENIAHTIAMHIAAESPLYIKPEDIPSDVLEKEKEIYREELSAKGAVSAAMVEKIILGKLQKFYEEVCLYNQKYIKDENISVREYIANTSSKDSAEVVSFHRCQI